MPRQHSSKLTPAVSYRKTPPALVIWGALIYDAIPMLVGVAEDGAVCRLAFLKDQKAEEVIATWRAGWKRTAFRRDAKAVAPVIAAIKAGKQVPLLMVGTEFQCGVWKNLLTIPPGKPVSYAELARRSKRPKAVRAVGTACGANPVAILVPCHRVIASNGGLGGFGGGLPAKKKLLRAEGWQQL